MGPADGLELHLVSHLLWIEGSRPRSWHDPGAAGNNSFLHSRGMDARQTGVSDVLAVPVMGGVCICLECGNSVAQLAAKFGIGLPLCSPLEATPSLLIPLHRVAGMLSGLVAVTLAHRESLDSVSGF